MENTRSKKPWPMKWIAVAIIVFIVPYTWISLHFRRPGKAFEPYADLRDEANAKRLLAGGYVRFQIPTADSQTHLADVTGETMAKPEQTLGGVPQKLAQTLVEPLPLVKKITDVVAATELPGGDDFALTFSTNGESISGADVFIHDNNLTIIPIPGHAADRADTAHLIVPSGKLTAGTYEVRLCAEEHTLLWTLHVH